MNSIIAKSGLKISAHNGDLNFKCSGCENPISLSDLIDDVAYCRNELCLRNFKITVADCLKLVALLTARKKRIRLVDVINDGVLSTGD